MWIPWVVCQCKFTFGLGKKWVMLMAETACEGRQECLVAGQTWAGPTPSWMGSPFPAWPGPWWREHAPRAPFLWFGSDQIRSVAQSCPTLCNSMNRSMPGLPVHHQLPEFTQTHVHRVGDAIQPSHPLSSPSPPTPNPSQHQSLFQWVNSLHEVPKVLEFQL